MNLDELLGTKKKAKKEIPEMYLEKKKRCPLTTLFDMPHLPEPMSAYQIAKQFPAFAKEMDGSSTENCLLYFYKSNKERKVYEFQDADMEEEMAEMLNVKIYDEAGKEEPPHESRPLTEEEHQLFREHIADIQEKIQELEQAS